MAQRSGALVPLYDPYEDLVDELDHAGMTWDEAIEYAGRSKDQISKALVRRGRQDLIKALQYKTYGAVGQPAIMSVVRRRQLDG